MSNSFNSYVDAGLKARAAMAASPPQTNAMGTVGLKSTPFKEMSYLQLLRLFFGHLQKKFTNFFLFRIRLIPLVIFFAVLVMGARVTTMITHIGEASGMRKAHASENPGDSKKDQLPLSHLDAKLDPKVETTKGLSDFDPFNMTADQYRVLKGVVAKSDKLSDRERSLSEKEQLLEALVKKMDEKVKELKQAKEDLQNLIGKIGEEENVNTKRLVKMVETMKPPQAAAVLEGVEFPILLEIMEQVKEQKAATILASMEPNKASYLVTALSKHRKVFDKKNPKKSVMQG